MAADHAGAAAAFVLCFGRAHIAVEVAARLARVGPGDAPGLLDAGGAARARVAPHAFDGRDLALRVGEAGVDREHGAVEL